MSNTQSVYFGGSRHLAPSQILASVVQAVLLSGQSVHVGCQFGADQQVIHYASHCYSGSYTKALSIFTVAAFSSAVAPHILFACAGGASVTLGAGGTSAPMPARYLLRSIAAFQGCSAAVFFSPGAGSLAVARECIKSGLPVYAFQQEPPARIPSTAGSWSASSFFGFSCWQWSAPIQTTLF